MRTINEEKLQEKVSQKKAGEVSPLPKKEAAVTPQTKEVVVVQPPTDTALAEAVLAAVKSMDSNTKANMISAEAILGVLKQLKEEPKKSVQEIKGWNCTADRDATGQLKLKLRKVF